MSATTYWVFLGISVGVLVAAQGPINAKLSLFVGGAMRASLVSFVIGAAVLLLANVLLVSEAVPAARIPAAPWWAWIGGGLGAGLVVASILAIPRVGVGSWTASLIAGQLAASVFYDHFGLLGQVKRDADLKRLAGMVVMLVGVWLIRKH